jgi:hypothetical protein
MSNTETIQYKGRTITLVHGLRGVRTLIDGRQTSALAYRGRALKKAKKLIDEEAV